MSTTRGEPKPTPWDRFKATLPCETVEALAAPPPNPIAPATAAGGEDEALYAAFAASLPAETQAALQAAGEADPLKVAPEPALAQHMLIECPDGEWATVRTFQSGEAQARRLGQLEGEDVIAVPVYGVLQKITKGPQRYVMQPDGKTALMIPVIKGATIRAVDADLLDSVEIQDDCYLGPPELAQAQEVKIVETAPARKDDIDDDDEEEEFAE